MQHTFVCLIIPVYNEGENLSHLIQEITDAMESQKHSWQVLFIDDGSNDTSLATLRDSAANDARVHFISFEKNCGQSAAFAAGFAESNADILVTLDSDLQNDPADIPRLLEVYDQGHDMVIGWRAKRQDSPAKRYASKIANAIRNKLSHETVKDTGCSLKVLNASMAKKLPMFTGMHRFLPTLMKMQGANIAELPVNHRPRIHGKSKYGIWDRAFSAFHDLLAIRWMQKRYFKYVIKEQQ